MRIKLDENLPVRMARMLAECGHDVDTVHQEGLAGRRDKEIWEAAQQGRRFLVTQDLDFSDRRRFAPGTHCGLLLVRLREPGRDALLRAVRQIFQSEDVTAWQGCVVVLTDRKVRILRPRT